DEPAADAREKRRQELAGNVVEDVEGADGVERVVWQLELREVRAEELRLGNCRARTLDLTRRDVDAGQRKALCEPLRLGRSAAAAELEHASAVLEPRDQFVLPFAPRVADDLLSPGGEGLADRVVAGGDDLRSRVGHGAMVLRGRPLHSRAGDGGGHSMRRPRTLRATGTLVVTGLAIP